MSNATRPPVTSRTEPVSDPTRGQTAGWSARKPTALLVLANGLTIEGFGVGATGAAVGEVCFNTAMTGYEEILTDPSYAGQIITFTFPHIGVVGTNEEDIETVNLAASAGARGAIFRADIAEPSNFRATRRLDAWLKARGIIGLTGIDTRALTAMIRREGMPNAVIAHDPGGEFDRAALADEAKAWPGIDGMDLVPSVTSAQRFDWDQTSWSLGAGYGIRGETRYRVVAVDYGIKRNILRLLSDCGCAVTVVPATSSAEDILALKPDGVFLSNGPGDPAETGRYAVPTIEALLAGQDADLRHLPGSPDARFGRRRPHSEDAAGSSRRQSPGQGFHDRQGRDRLDEPRLRHRRGEPAGERAPDARLAVRRFKLRHRIDGPPGLFRSTPPRGVARAARQPLPLPPLRRFDGRAPSWRRRLRLRRRRLPPSKR